MGLDPDKKKEAHITDYDPNRLIIIFFVIQTALFIPNQSVYLPK